MTHRPATSTRCATNWLDVLLGCEPSATLPALLATCSRSELEALLGDWAAFARPDQRPPAMGRDGLPWTVWLVLGGRGAGKTRTGAEWVRRTALGDAAAGLPPVGRIALVGESLADARDVMVEGVSGLLAVHTGWERPSWSPSLRRLVWRNGSVGQVFSAEDPESLRGPQFGAAWCDELAKWRRPDAAWDMLQFALRLGQAPRQVVTTTPRPIPLLRRLMADPRTALTRAATLANARNLAPNFLDAIVGRYAGTRLGRQELDGELVEDRPDALWTRALIEGCRRDPPAPPLVRLVVAVDPPASSARRADRCGIVAAGLDREGRVHVLEDATLQGVRPAAWASAVAAVARRLEADAVVVEVNQGGEMAEAVLKETDPGLAVRPVRATRGKHLRAEPVAHLYEQGRVVHVGAFPALEDELCDFGPIATGWGLSDGRSPDRLDALVWAVTALALAPRAPRPRVRRV